MAPLGNGIIPSLAQNFNIQLQPQPSPLPPRPLHHQPQSSLRGLNRNEHNVPLRHAPGATRPDLSPHSIAQDVHDPRPPPTLPDPLHRPPNSPPLELHPLHRRLGRPGPFNRHLSSPCHGRHADPLRSPKHHERRHPAGPEAQTRIPLQDAEPDGTQDLVEEEAQGPQAHCSIRKLGRNM